MIMMVMDRHRGGLYFVLYGIRIRPRNGRHPPEVGRWRKVLDRKFTAGLLVKGLNSGLLSNTIGHHSGVSAFVIFWSEGRNPKKSEYV